jgi:hypothetical protein
MKWIANVNTVLPQSFKKAEIYMAMEYDIVVTNNLTFDMYSEVNLDHSRGHGGIDPPLLFQHCYVCCFSVDYTREQKQFLGLLRWPKLSPYLRIWVNAPDLDADAVWFHATTLDHHLMFISYFFVPPAANKD